MRKLVKLIILILAISAILYLIIIAVIFFQPRAEPIVYLIPEGYIGPILISLNQRNGFPVEYENKKRVYRIPKNGVLMSQFGDNIGPYKLSDIEFYYEASDGARKKLKYIPFKYTSGYTKNMEANELDEIIAFSNSVGTTYKDNGEMISIETHIIGSINEAEKLSRQEIKLINILQSQ